MTTKPMTCSIVIPVFNAESTLRELCTQLTEQLAPLGQPFEVILVDDCSLDNSWNIMRQLAAGDQRIICVQLMSNSGQGAATMAGLGLARGKLVVTMDDDLQNPPHEVPRLLSYLEENPAVDAVFARPREKRHSFWRRAGSELVNRLSNLMFSQDPGFKLTSFRVIRREVVAPLLRINMPEPPIGALVSTLTRRIANIDVDHADRSSGQSGYSVRKLLKVTLSKFLGFSTFPLRLLAAIGVFGIATSFLLGAYIVVRYLFGSITVPGWTTLTLLLIGISGFMFLAFGIIGEYLQQILLNTRRNPAYILRPREQSDPAPDDRAAGTEQPSNSEDQD